MLFVTNHAKKNGRASEINKPFVFEQGDNEVGQQIYFCEDKNGIQTEIGANKLLTELRETDAQELLIYFHGFNVQPAKAIEHGRKMQGFFTELGASIKVVPFIWPCGDKTGIIRDYYDDQDSANASAIAFARMMAKFMDWQEKNRDDGIACMKRVNILSHSMGNRVFRNSMAYWLKNYSKTANAPFLFRNVFMVAADIANQSLEKTQNGYVICEASRNVITYFASDDQALRGSKVANVKRGQLTRRLGHTGPEDMKKSNSPVPDNVFAVDCSDVNSEYDSPMGHSYFIDDKSGKPNKVFLHIAETIKTGRLKADQHRILVIE